MSFDHLSEIFHLQTMELFDFRGSNFLSIDETMVPFQSSNPDWKDKLRYIPRKPHPYGLLVNNLAGSTTHEKPVCIMLMPQLQGRKPKEIIEEAVEMIKRAKVLVVMAHSPRQSQLSLIHILDHWIIVKLGTLLSGI